MNRAPLPATAVSRFPAESDREAARKGLFECYLPQILQCRLEDLVPETPIQAMPLLSERLGIDVLVKREDLLPVFSFKLRGAYAKLKSLNQKQRQRGVICASAGNHARAWPWQHGTWASTH